LGGAINYVARHHNLKQLKAAYKARVAGGASRGSSSEKIMAQRSSRRRSAARAVCFVLCMNGGYVDNIGTGSRTRERWSRALEVLWAPTDGTITISF